MLMVFLVVGRRGVDSPLFSLKVSPFLFLQFGVVLDIKELDEPFLSLSVSE